MKRASSAFSRQDRKGRGKKIMNKGMKILIVLGILNLLLLLVIAGNYFMIFVKVDEMHWYPDRILENASALEARGLFKASVDELDRYRATGAIDEEEEADLLYKMGKMADEKLGDCDRALAYYTMATSLNPDASWSSDAGKATVVCMEKAGKNKQAQALLRQLTGNEDEVVEPEGEGAEQGQVVAVVGGRNITWAEVEAHAAAKAGEEKLDDPAFRNRMIQHYVFTLMLAEEAVKKGYETRPDVRPLLEQARREALAAEYMKRQVEDFEDKEAVKKLWDDLVKLHEARIFPFSVPETEDEKTE
jgi:tetratricopeptide (TPR) repeat protein